MLQSASAAFTPTFQATIPDVLTEEARYTRALSLSRLAYDLENIVSPTLAALLLAVMSYNALFLGTVAGALFALRLWQREYPKYFEHTHEHLTVDHPHLKGERRYAHVFVVDDEHPRWTSQL